MTYDLTALRAQVPALAAGTAHFDGPGGTQMPLPVIEAIGTALSRPLSIRGEGLPGERNAEDIVTGTRRAMADLLGADPAGIVFGRSATQLTYDFSRTLAGGWSPGDEVVVTRLDHDANIRPWVQAAERSGCTVRWADFDPATGELTADDIRAVLSERTRLVAVTAASNLIGTMPPVAEIARIVHEAGALLYVDGVHHTAHARVDLEALGADFLVCSPYKFLGPHHGVLAARPALLETLRPDKLLPSTDAVPERFELGTLPYEFLAGTRAAVDFLAGLAARASGGRRERLDSAFEAIGEHEDTLRGRLEEGLAAFGEVTVHSRAARRTPTLLLTLEGHDTADAYRFLAERGVHAPSGTFYALEASRRLGLGDTGGLRVGLAPYTGTEDVERLLEGLSAFLGRTPRTARGRGTPGAQAVPAGRCGAGE
ncbi:cysteine desulfurase-like protein [Streptomyces griseomycini]|uniref:Cysteine desulfurase family protein (TIGR01976 family) n=1 Tax=Streptomyces griseomycini TaxID=66895 RepID=A0A7W7PSB1_9ACTN|nr:cysteine desulfurase-like protein [Streptomyces griseomycini]MBB4899060.1 cysteine desulfurase family protein (TIGR01976 family) [Streptomyces griseomycini]GGR21564.1 cysteine desulfurase-like protein [Streptomyces griseomycini]